MSTATIEKICDQDLAGAYVDGELDADLTLLFEGHLPSCSDCQFELRAHRLFVCELDAAMTSSDEIPVPRNFSHIIATRATTDMRGVRTRSENRKAHKSGQGRSYIKPQNRRASRAKSADNLVTNS